MTYYAGIREGLFDAEHRRRMGDAIWLVGWLIAKQTKEIDGVGWVLGGKVMAFAEIAERTGYSAATIRRWADRLRGEGPQKVHPIYSDQPQEKLLESRHPN